MIVISTKWQGLYCFGYVRRSAHFGRKPAAYKYSQRLGHLSKKGSMDLRLNPHLPIITPRIEFSSLTQLCPPATITPRIDFADAWTIGNNSASHIVSDFAPFVNGDDDDSITVDLELLESEPSDDEMPLNNSGKIPKPPGEPGRPNSGGYNVENEVHAWGADKISQVTVSLKTEP